MKKKGLLTIFSISAFGFLISSGIINKNASLNNLNVKNKSYIILFDSESKKNEFDIKTRSIKDLYDIKTTYNGLVYGYQIKASSNFKSYLTDFSGISYFNEEKEFNVDTSSTFYDSSSVFHSPIKNNSKSDLNVPSQSKEGEGTLIAVLDTSFSLKHNAFQDLSSDIDVKLTKTDVDELVNNKKLSATNIKSYYYNSKIPFYHDYGGSASYSESDGYKKGKEDDNVESSYSYHGMHVASIATGNGKIYQGIASNAQLAFMKITSTVDSLSNEAFLESSYLSALNDCYTLGVDVINMSFGAALDEFNDTSIELIMNKLKSKGVVISTAAGNDGKGNWNKSGAYKNDTTGFINGGTVGTMGLFNGTSNVASSNLKDDTNVDPIVTLNGEDIYVYDEILASNHSDGSEYAITPNMPFTSLIKEDESSSSYEYVVVPNVGKTSDYKKIDVKGKIALILRGDIDFQTKIKNAKDNGAIGCIIGNTEDATFGMGFNSGSEELFVPTVGVSSSNYNKLKDSETKVISISKEVISGFSSEGTNDNLEITQDVTTPGNNIAGAINVDKTITHDGYAYVSGTSMAAPNYAGSAALILGEQEFEDDIEELEYKETLLARTMSTASPLFENNGSPISVRKQGAGLVNVTNAIESDVYLSGNTSDGAKIELKNNDDIKEGNINFDVTINNENNRRGSYKATLYVTTNDTEVYTSSDSDFNGVTLKKDNNRLIDKKEFEVNLNGEDIQTFNVNYSLSDKDKEELNKTFENGTFIEGYVILTSNSSSLKDLSIPYMGFYGDYNKVDCVEPFDFEKDDNKVYQSELLNNLADVLNTTYAKPNADFSSLIGVSSGIGKTDISNILNNAKGPYDYYVPAIATLESDGYYHIRCGGKTSKTLYIQQFVNRTVKTNVLTLKDSNGNIVLTDHMFDALYGDDEINKTWPLYKSVPTTSLLTNGYYAHRAYTILNLKDKSNDTYYEDGTYKMEMEYTLNDGSIQTKTYILEIDSTTSEDIKINNATLSNDIITFTGNIKAVSGFKGKHKIDEDNTSLDISSISNEEEVITFTIYSSSYASLSCFFDRKTKTIFTSSKYSTSINYSVSASKGLGSDATYTITITSTAGKTLSLSKNGELFIVLGDENNEATFINIEDVVFKGKYNGNSYATLYVGGAIVLVVLILGTITVIYFIKKKKKKDDVIDIK